MRPFRMQGLQLRPLGPGCAPRPRMRPAGPPRAQPTAQLPPRPAPGRGPRGTRPRGQGPREGGRCPRPRAPSSPSPACGACGWSSPAGRNVLRLYFRGFSVASSHVMGNWKTEPPGSPSLRGGRRTTAPSREAGGGRAPGLRVTVVGVEGGEGGVHLDSLLVRLDHGGLAALAGVRGGRVGTG